jgi:hypothetical protein
MVSASKSKRTPLGRFYSSIKCIKYTFQFSTQVSSLRRFKVGARAARLNNLLDNFLCFVPIVLIQLYEIDTIEIRNVGQCLQASSIKYEADTNANTSKSSSTANTVKVGLWISLSAAVTLRWDIVVNNHGNRLNINASSKNIGGNKNLRLARPEAFQDTIALRPFERTVDSNYSMAGCGERRANSGCCFSGLYALIGHIES